MLRLRRARHEQSGLAGLKEMEKTRNRSFTSAAEGGTSFAGVSVYWLMVFAIPPRSASRRRVVPET